MNVKGWGELIFGASDWLVVQLLFLNTEGATDVPYLGFVLWETAE